MTRKRVSNLRSRKDKKQAGPKKWSRVHGTVYVIRTRDAKNRRTLFLRRTKMGVGYVGMYSGDWKERIRQHLYGGGRYGCEPKVWADLVPGFDPNARTLKQQQATVKAVIAAGGAYRIWHKNCFYWHVKLRESWHIATMRPRYNIAENTHNSRHVPKWTQMKQRELRDRALIAEESRVEDGIRLLRDGSCERYGGGLVTRTTPVKAYQSCKPSTWSRLLPDGSVRWYGPDAELYQRLDEELREYEKVN